jgi:hypothetical protein
MSSPPPPCRSALVRPYAQCKVKEESEQWFSKKCKPEFSSSTEQASSTEQTKH